MAFIQMPSWPTSSTHIGCDKDFLLSLSETLDDCSSLFNSHLPTKQSHLVALFGQFSC